MNLNDIKQKIENILETKGTKNIDATVKFNMKDEGVITVDCDDDNFDIKEEDLPADCTITISADNLDKLIDGKLNPMIAFTMGKLKIKGDMALAMKLTKIFTN